MKTSRVQAEKTIKQCLTFNFKDNDCIVIRDLRPIETDKPYWLFEIATPSLDCVFFNDVQVIYMNSVGTQLRLSEETIINKLNLA